MKRKMIPDQTITQLLDNLIRQPVEQGTLPHLYAAVARDGQLVYEGEAGDTARDRIYRIMSMTKAVTSVACMQLVATTRNTPADYSMGSPRSMTWSQTSSLSSNTGSGEDTWYPG